MFIQTEATTLIGMRVDDITHPVHTGLYQVWHDVMDDRLLPVAKRGIAERGAEDVDERPPRVDPDRRREQPGRKPAQTTGPALPSGFAV